MGGRSITAAGIIVIWLQAPRLKKLGAFRFVNGYWRSARDTRVKSYGKKVQRKIFIARRGLDSTAQLAPFFSGLAGDLGCIKRHQSIIFID
ncbi:MAG: hypothetical protein GX930_04990 [Clostridia bacterium]|nr:hypothetical protein [Clostridia bacterium]